MPHADPATTPRSRSRQSLPRLTTFVLATALAVASCGSDSTTQTTVANSDESGEQTTGQLDSMMQDDGETLSDAAEPLPTPERVQDPEHPADDTPTEQGATDDPPEPDLGPLLAAPGERTNWTGQIGDDIDVALWFAQVDDVVRGEITYGSSGQPITILGSRAQGQNWYALEEFGTDGRVSGYMTLGSVAGGVISDATWGTESLSLTLVDSTPTTTALEPIVREAIFTSQHAPFRDGDGLCCGAMDRLTVSSVTTTSATIAIQNTTGGPAFNLAFIDKTVVPLDRNRATFVLDDDGFDCAFAVDLYDDFARVSHLDDRFDCGFGNAAGVDGFYLLTEELIAAEYSPFREATLEFDTFGPVALGDTWASLTERFGVRPHDPEEDDTLFGECSYVIIDNDPLSPWFMMLGDGDAWVVSRIELDDPNVRTAAGVGVGSTASDIRAAYDGQIEAGPHPYLRDGAEYLRVTSPKTDRDTTTILFETNESGTVTSMRNGFVDPIQWIEGCA